MALIKAQQPWPNAIIYYSISSHFTPDEAAKVEQAIRNWNAYSGYQFIEQNGQQNYVKFVYDTYIRKEGSNNWLMASAQVNVELSGTDNLRFTNYLSDIELGPDYGQKVFLRRD